MSHTSFEMMHSFAKKMHKFRNSLVPGMTLRVHLETGDRSIDTVPRLAYVVKVYQHYCLLKDNKGRMYGPTYHKLMGWGNQ